VLPFLSKADFSGSGALLRGAWDRVSPLPGGRRVFDLLLGFINPYTGSVRPRFLELAPGHCRVEMLDRRAVRNHVNSLHAIAMANLGEMSTGLALMAGLPEDARAIITNLSIDYLKKGRGRLVAECRCDPPASSERREVELEGTIHDGAGELVARVRARWMIGPKAGRP
jgi:acyl-coenzyme A thioesterase PaaI-like protein